MFEYPFIDPAFQDGSLRPITPSEQKTIDMIAIGAAIVLMGSLVLALWLEPAWFVGPTP